MVSLIIDNKKVFVPREITILEAARIAGNRNTYTLLLKGYQ